MSEQWYLRPERAGAVDAAEPPPCGMGRLVRQVFAASGSGAEATVAAEESGVRGAGGALFFVGTISTVAAVVGPAAFRPPHLLFLGAAWLSEALVPPKALGTVVVEKRPLAASTSPDGREPWSLWDSASGRVSPMSSPMSSSTSLGFSSAIC